ncbi:hypothetical protein SDC9_199768 [bioreactor metagenome]|uniref:HTH-type transcriptional regulator CymR n=1 Tax=bioreactor metagenome TaxID=1076179 RepID=A0A645IUP4_9ZZZZ|nr:Rrf2 family transcriptional regulator [Oscillospiraceae bacterium]
MNGDFAAALYILLLLGYIKEPRTSVQLSESTYMNPARIRKLCSMLKSAGYIGAKEGRGGGIYLTCNIKKITLCDVCRSVCGEPFGGISASENVSSGMEDVLETLSAELNKACAGVLGHITVYDMEKTLAKKQKSELFSQNIKKHTDRT